MRNSVGIARFSGPAASPVDVVAVGDARWCASMLKPLYFWAAARLAPFADDRLRWRMLAAPAVTTSANDPTTEVWETVGEHALLAELRRISGVAFSDADQVGHPWGRVPVTAAQLAGAYAALAADPGDVAAELRGYLLAVPDEQTFGVRAAFAERIGVAPGEVMAKSGWFSAPEETGIRTHSVALHGGPGRFTGVAVTTFVETTPTARATYAATYADGPEVLPIHRATAGELLVDAVRRAWQ